MDVSQGKDLYDYSQEFLLRARAHSLSILGLASTSKSKYYSFITITQVIGCAWK